MSRNWAIAIGINNYDNLQPLMYAKRDAEAMTDWFQEEAKFDKVFLFTEDSPYIPARPSSIPTMPTYCNLRRFLRVQFEAPLLKPGDNLWFFFAGHGIRVLQKDYLMVSDSDPGDVENTAISVEYILERLSGSGADNVVLFLDACRDETDERSRNRGSRGILGIGEEEHQGVIVFYACNANQQSWEIDEIMQGSFTYTLLEGLRHQGNVNCATVERLDRYLNYEVPRLNSLYQKPQQNPYLTAEPPYKIYFILLEKYATFRDTEPLRLQASQAENRQDLSLARRLWVRVLALSCADWDAINAIERIAVKQYISTNNGDNGDDEEGSTSDPSEDLHFPEDLQNGVILDMVYIPGGTCLIGTEDEEIQRLSQEYALDYFSRERPQYQVTITTFWMSCYPITQAQWREVAGWDHVDRRLDQYPSRFREPYEGVDRWQRPVESISWEDAIEFCARLSRRTKRDYRLPTEAEWEYACRAGTATPFHFGETISTELANYRGTEGEYNGRIYSGIYGRGVGVQGIYREQTTPVGSFPPNAFGLYDMHGNVWEWCEDDWHEDYQDASRDGRSSRTGSNPNIKAMRGGSWYNFPWSCRSAFRSLNPCQAHLNSFGFRVVCIPPGT